MQLNGSTSMQLNSRSKIESPEHATEEHVQQCKSEVEKLKCQLDQRISELARNHQEKEIMELERERQMEKLEILVTRRGCDLETSQRVLQLTKSQVDNLLRDLSSCQEDLRFSRSQVDDLQQELARSQEELQLSKSQIHDLQRDQKLYVRELKRELSFFQERTAEESARLQKKTTEEQVSAYESKIEMLESKVEMLEGQLEQRDIALHLAKSQEEDLHLSKSRVGNLELNLQQEKATSSQEKASSLPQSLESNKWRELNKMIRTL